jgi:hypothetical protein
MEHQHKLDDRGICEQCILANQQQEQKYNFQELMHTWARIPENLEEFPTPYEMGMMESGEWN